MIRGRTAVAAALAVVALSGCLGDEDKLGSAQEGGAAFVALGVVPRVLDPALAADAATETALWLVYTPPLTYRRAEGEDGTEVVPGVAQDLPEVSGDGRTYSLRVRHGLRYSNGRPVRAADVRHSILRAATLGRIGRRLFRGVVAIEANDRTGAVRIHLSEPDPSFVHALAAVQAGVIPASTPMRDRSERPPPGVGPYRLAAGGRGESVDLLRDREFRLPGVAGGLIDLFRLRAPRSPADEVEAVNAGLLDVMTSIPPVPMLPELRSEEGDRYSEHPAIASQYLEVRADRAPLHRPELREALAYAIDKPEAARRLEGLAQPTCSVLPPELPGYAEPDPCPWGDPDEHPDLLRAQELVEEAGAEGALITVGASPHDRPVARLYVETLRQIGLQAEAATGARAQADVTLSVARSTLPDPAAFLGPLARRVPLVVDPEPLLVADQLASAVDPDEAAELAERLDRELVESAVVIPYAGVLDPLLLSARMDAENCARVHPVYGIDLSSLCLR
jgi:peptide/nickel transport system substrate-binding protein